MKCALEMAIAIKEEEKRLEEEKRRKEEEKRKRFEALVEKFYYNIESIDKYVERKLLDNKGCVELLISCYKDNAIYEGFGYFTHLDNSYAKQNGGYPSYFLNFDSADFPIDIYVKYLESHCYKVAICDYDFKGASSTGKTSMICHCKKLKISI